MKKLFVPGIVVVFVMVLVFACSSGGGQYSDAIEVNTKFADAMEKYIDSLQTADNASSIAAAIETFAENVEKIAPRMREIIEKYPELKNQDNLPKALKASQEKANALGEKMAGVMMKAMQHMGDKKVQTAQMRLQKAMMGMMKKP